MSPFGAFIPLVNRIKLSSPFYYALQPVCWMLHFRNYFW